RPGPLGLSLAKRFKGARLQGKARQMENQVRGGTKKRFTPSLLDRSFEILQGVGLGKGKGADPGAPQDFQTTAHFQSFSQGPAEGPDIGSRRASHAEANPGQLQGEDFQPQDTYRPGEALHFLAYPGQLVKPF